LKYGEALVLWTRADQVNRRAGEQVNFFMSIDNDLKVAVLMGGIGHEREISLHSGENIANAIREAGIEVVETDIRPDDMSILDDKSIDVFFLALHGEFGEDGQIQQILDDKGLAYTGSGAKASRNAFDKVISKEIFVKAGIDVPRHFLFEKSTQVEAVEQWLGKIGDRVVVKPIKQGSSVGVEIVEGKEAVLKAATSCLGRFGGCMIEEYLDGREITVGIVNGRALPVTEIRSKSDFYDYQAKYLADSTEYLFDTIADETLIEKLNDIAIRCFNSLGCRHLGRVDMIVTNGTPYVLELNTLPGFTSHSLLPMAANKASMSTAQLCREIIEAAVADSN